MKRIAVTVAALITLSGSAFAASYKPCEELKAEIDEKIKAKGGVNYTLEIIPESEVKNQEIVGSCEGGKKKIAYVRGQQAVVTSKASYEVVSKACVNSVSDIGFVLSNNDQVQGIIIARPVLEGEDADSKLSIVLKKSDKGVSVTVGFDPAPGTKGRAGIVEAYLKALKVRVPDVAASSAN
jgi:hypothetical protein